jgi:hypothetical protein
MVIRWRPGMPLARRRSVSAPVRWRNGRRPPSSFDFASDTAVAPMPVAGLSGPDRGPGPGFRPGRPETWGDCMSGCLHKMTSPIRRCREMNTFEMSPPSTYARRPCIGTFR